MNRITATTACPELAAMVPDKFRRQRLRARSGRSVLPTSRANCIPANRHVRFLSASSPGISPLDPAIAHNVAQTSPLHLAPPAQRPEYYVQALIRRVRSPRRRRDPGPELRQAPPIDWSLRASIQQLLVCALWQILSRGPRLADHTRGILTLYAARGCRYSVHCCHACNIARRGPCVLAGTAPRKHCCALSPANVLPAFRAAIPLGRLDPMSSSCRRLSLERKAACLPATRRPKGIRIARTMSETPLLLPHLTKRRLTALPLMR